MADESKRELMAGRPHTRTPATVELIQNGEATLELIEGRHMDAPVWMLPPGTKKGDLILIWMERPKG